MVLCFIFMKYFLFKSWSDWEGILKVCLCSSEVNFNIWLENTKWPKCHHRTWCYTNGDTLQDRKTHTQSALHRKQIDTFCHVNLDGAPQPLPPLSSLCVHEVRPDLRNLIEEFHWPQLKLFPSLGKIRELVSETESHLPPGLPNRNLQGKTGTHLVVKNFSVQ